MTRSFDNHSDWIEARKAGIGASEASCIVGVNKWKTNIDLWEEKIGIRVPDDISDKPQVQYGKKAEQYLRELFILDFPEYLVGYDEFGMVSNLDNYPWLFATLDGDLTEISTGRKGILEIKTAEIIRSSQWKEWDNQIPQHYYVQVLHQFLATGYDFAILKAQIRWKKGNELNISTKHFFMERSESESDMEWLLDKECQFWECVTNKTKPALILPEI